MAILTDFTAPNTEAPQLQSAVTPQQGVVDKTASTLTSGLASMFDKATNYLVEDKALRSNKLVAEFQNQQLLIADGLEQGTIGSSAEARTRMRKNLLDAIQAHPEIADKFIAADGALSGLPEGTSVARTGTLEEQRWNAQKDQLASAGLIAGDAPDSEYRRVAADWESAQATLTAHNAKMNALEEEAKLLTLGSAERTAKEAEIKALTISTVRSVLPLERTKMQNDFEAIIKDPNKTESEKQMAIEDYYNKWQGEVATSFGTLDTSQATLYLDVFEKLKTTYLDRASGKLNDEETKRQAERAINTQKAMMLADPNVAAFAAASTLSQTDVFVAALSGITSQAVANGLLDRMGKADNSNNLDDPSPYVNNPDDRKALGLHLNIITGALDDPDPAKAKAARDQLGTYLKQIEQESSKIAHDPAKAIEVINWLSSSSFLSARKAHPELFDNMAPAIEILKTNYADQVLQLVQEQYTANHVIIPAEPNSPDGKMTALGWVKQGSTNDFVMAVTTSSGVNFVPIDSKDSHAAVLANKLNRDLKPVINNTVRAFAHLEGRSDYGAVWTDMSSQVLNGDVQGQAGDSRMGGSAGNDQLSMSDFGTPVSIDPNSPVKGGAGWTEVTNPDGEVVRRTGPRSWRNNNPGNIEYGSFAKDHGAIGSDGRFAVFPSYEAGRAAKESLLFDSAGYAGKTIEEAINRYAPPSENDSSWYANSVAEAIGVDVNTPLSSLSSDQRSAMLDAMQVVEGWRVGKETKVN
jgi:hypothetical protein